MLTTISSSYHQYVNGTSIFLHESENLDRLSTHATLTLLTEHVLAVSGFEVGIPLNLLYRFNLYRRNSNPQHKRLET